MFVLDRLNYDGQILDEQVVAIERFVKIRFMLVISSSLLIAFIMHGERCTDFESQVLFFIFFLISEPKRILSAVGGTLSSYVSTRSINVTDQTNWCAKWKCKAFCLD